MLYSLCFASRITPIFVFSLLFLRYRPWRLLLALAVTSPWLLSVLFWLGQLAPCAPRTSCRKTTQYALRLLVGLHTIGSACQISARHQASRGPAQVWYRRQASRRWYLLCQVSRRTLAGRFGVLACALSTHTMVLLGSMVPASLFLFRQTQIKTGRLWSRTTIHPSRFFLRAFCPLLDGGQILCRKNPSMSMEIGGCCACSEPIAAVLTLDTIENQIWAWKHSGPWRQSALTSIVFLGPSVVQGNAKPPELWGILQQWHNAMSGASVMSVSTRMHPSTQSYAQEQTEHWPWWKTGCMMWNWERQRCSFLRRAVLHTPYADDAELALNSFRIRSLAIKPTTTEIGAERPARNHRCTLMCPIHDNLL